MVVAEIVTAVSTINALIKLFKGIVSTYRLGRELLSDDWKNEYRKYVDYLEEVEREVTLQSHCSETAITGALKLLEGELKEAWSFVDEWMKKSDPQKRVTSGAFIEKLRTSRTTIAQNLQLLSVQLLRTYREQVPHITYVQNLLNVGSTMGSYVQNLLNVGSTMGSYVQNLLNQSLTGSGKVHQPSYTNPVLKIAGQDWAMGAMLWDYHMKNLKQYQQLLKKKIKPGLESKYLTSWTDAERLLQWDERFRRFPETHREIEWQRHIHRISKKRRKTK